MAESFVVRPAQNGDATALATLNREFNDQARTPDEIAASLRSGLHSERVLAVEVGGDVVGFACVQFLYSMCYAAPWAELTELYVRQGYRRQGIGRALVHEAERCARENGATEIVVRTGERNVAGQALYEAQGYCTRPHLTLRKALSRLG